MLGFDEKQRLEQVNLRNWKKKSCGSHKSLKEDQKSCEKEENQETVKWWEWKETVEGKMGRRKIT